MPLFHTMGLRSLLATVLAAGTWVPQAKFDADASLELIVREKVGALYLVPTIFWSCSKPVASARRRPCASSRMPGRR